jgi:hypothetical protein
MLLYNAFIYPKHTVLREEQRGGNKESSCTTGGEENRIVKTRRVIAGLFSS